MTIRAKSSSVRITTAPKHHNNGHPLLGRIVAPHPHHNHSGIPVHHGRIIRTKEETHLVGKLLLPNGKPAPKGSHIVGRLIPATEKPKKNEHILGRLVDGDKHEPALFVGRIVVPNGDHDGAGSFDGRLVEHHADGRKGRPHMGRTVPHHH